MPIFHSQKHPRCFSIEQKKCWSNINHENKKAPYIGSFLYILFQIFGIEPIKLGQDEAAVFADEDIVEVDLAAAVFGCLDADEIPVDR